MRLALLATLVLAACSPAHSAERRFPVGGFDKVRNGAPVDVHVRTGGAPSVVASGAPEMLERLTVEVRGGELVVGMKRGSWMSGWSWKGRQRTVIDVSVPMIVAASLVGPGDLTVDRVRAPAFAASLSGPGNLGIGMVETRTATLSLSGPGDLTIAGRADSATLSLSGPGDIHAKGFTARDVTVSLSGPGDIDVGATGTAIVNLSGPGDVRIAGHPRCTVRKSGPGDVSCG